MFDASDVSVSAMHAPWWCRHHKVDFEAGDDALRCPAGDHRVPIRDGIPRFVTGANYAAAFGNQWNTYRLTQLDSYTGTSISRDRLRRNLGGLWSGLSGARVLECGCGAGRFTEVLLKHGALVTSIDLSEAVDANAENFAVDESHRVAQADIGALPFAAGQFDVVLCLGVVQHTPKPEKTIAALYEQIRPGGHLVFDHYTYSLPRMTRISVPIARMWLLRQPPDRQLAATVRLVDRFLPFHQGRFARVVRRLSPVTSYYHVYPELPDRLRREWALLDTHDSLTAVYKHMRTAGQLRRTLGRLGADDIVTARAGIGIEVRCRRPVTA